jgi:hypothetical protein
MQNIEFIKQDGKVSAHFRVPTLHLEAFRGECGLNFPNALFKESHIFIGRTRFFMVETLEDLPAEKCNKFVQDFNKRHAVI